MEDKYLLSIKFSNYHQMTFLYKSELGGKVIQLSTVALERSLIGILNKKSGKTTASKRVLKCIPADMR